MDRRPVSLGTMLLAAVVGIPLALLVALLNWITPGPIWDGTLALAPHAEHQLTATVDTFDWRCTSPHDRAIWFHTLQTDFPGRPISVALHRLPASAHIGQPCRPDL